MTLSIDIKDLTRLTWIPHQRRRNLRTKPNIVRKSCSPCFGHQTFKDKREEGKYPAAGSSNTKGKDKTKKNKTYAAAGRPEFPSTKRV